MLRRTMLSLGTLVVAGFALSTSGCLALISGTHDTTVTFPLDRHAGGTTFWAWNEITVSEDISSVNSAKLIAVTLTVEAPAGSDFSFLQSLQGEAVTASGRTQVASLDTVSQGDQYVVMKILYTGDLHPLFKDAHTIRLEWSGATNPAYTPWPTGGFTITATIQIDVE